MENEKWFEVQCEPGNLHFTARDRNENELIKLVQMHLKNTHGQDISSQEARSYIHEVREPETARPRRT